jgi:hypothetical protein
MLVDSVTIISGCTLEAHYDDPLPGTNDKGVVYLKTAAPVQIWFEGERPLVENIQDDGSFIREEN